MEGRRSSLSSSPVATRLVSTTSSRNKHVLDPGMLSKRIARPVSNPDLLFDQRHAIRVLFTNQTPSRSNPTCHPYQHLFSLVVQIFPSSTHLAWAIQSTFGPKAIVPFHATLFVVAFLRSSTPARARLPEPVHTQMRYWSSGYLARTKINLTINI